MSYLDITRSPNDHSENYTERLSTEWKKTEIKYYPIPVGIGIAFIALQTLYHKYNEHEANKKDQHAKNRPVIVGPWQVHTIDALPLRALSRLWGKINNEYTLPVWMRAPFYGLYSWIFKCNLKEIENTDLKSYPNLGAFFYRSLKPGSRPIDNEFLISPADGTVLTFGLVDGGKVEQVKGITYSLDAFLGHKDGRSHTIDLGSQVVKVNKTTHIVDEREFANVNGITYSLDSLLGDGPVESIKEGSTLNDASIKLGSDHEKKEQVVAKNVNKNPIDAAHGLQIKEGNALFFCVIYLAPGDYHRFHSPTNWVVESRRHFAGELFSVSPYMVKLMPDLFVLNERVVLLGRWRYGFFAMIPVGATNVGSIKINFDRALRTNRKEDLAIGTYTEASYKNASKLLSGYPLRISDEIGGFRLGSTVVLVFEAPLNFKFSLESNQKIKYGQKLGVIPTE
ncbi:2442_t:CDS:2 [Acaulospora morrowiae]|uniref:Phosphatidylserine decarboxylase proenzyme 1, mitochondrial n=1 Tax=Acaulospora morrowiae TaxID=94023 RepID=A0A9N9FLC0_9GLOM|nr:2442_t:CDS:2 [Acaulospora morrowiae]